MIFSVIYYFLLPIGAAYFQELFKPKVWGPVNVGILFALSEFVVAWTIAFVYSHKANAEFDAMAREIMASTCLGRAADMKTDIKNCLRDGVSRLCSWSVHLRWPQAR